MCSKILAEKVNIFRDLIPIEKTRYGRQSLMH